MRFSPSWRGWALMAGSFCLLTALPALASAPLAQTALDPPSAQPAPAPPALPPSAPDGAAVLDGPDLVVLPLPAGTVLDREGKLSATLRAVGTDPRVRMRWFALDRNNWVLFQRPFEMAAGGEAVDVSDSLYLWRWGDAHVGDWSEVRSIALQIESDVDNVWVDALALDAGPGDTDPRELAGPEAWLKRIAFGDHETRERIAEGYVLLTDAVDDLHPADLREMHAQMRRTRAWVRRTFGPAVHPIADATPVRFLLFRRRSDYAAFYRRLGTQWNCSIAAPRTPGYTIQDISACWYDPAESGQAVFLHEAAHSVIAHDLRLPTGTAEHSWLQEGLANYLQICVFPGSLDVEAFAKNFDEPIGHDSFFRPLSELCHQRCPSRHYAQLASVVSFLASQRPGWLREIAAGLSAGRGLEDVLAELGTDVNELESLWYIWGRLSFTAPPAPGGSHPHFPRPVEWK